MPMKNVQIGNQVVAFPDSMSDDDINKASQNIYAEQTKDATSGNVKQSFSTQHPFVSKALDTLAPYAGGAMLSEFGVPPVGQAIGQAGIGIATSPDKSKDLGHSIVNLATDSFTNYYLGKTLELLPKAGRAVGNLLGASTVPQTLLDLKPTVAQLTNNAMAKAHEDIFSPEAKREAIQKSVTLARGQAENLASAFAGRSVRLSDVDRLASTISDKTASDYAKFKVQSKIYAEDAKGIASSGLNSQQFVVGQNPPTTSIGPLGMPITVPGTPIIQKVDGAIYPDNLLHKVLQYKKDLVGTAKTPDPNNPFLRDLDGFLNFIGYQEGKNGAPPQYRPLSFEEAWNTKQDYGTAGWEGTTETGTSVVDKRYRDLHNAMSKDIQTSIPQWQTNGDKALAAYNNANKMVSARHALFDEPQSSRMINLKSQEDPDARINAIVNDNTKLKPFLISNEYKLPDGTSISSTNKRSDLKAYKFMQLWNDNFTSQDPKDLTKGVLNSDKLITDWNKYKVSKEGKTLYNQADQANIDQFFDAVSKVNTDPGGSGASRYLTVRLATGGFRLASVAAASMLLGGGSLNTAGVAGTVALTGAVLSARQIGRLLTNPDYAPILNKLALGEPLGRSMQGAMQMLAYGLRNESIKGVFGNGTEADVKLDSQGKPKSMFDKSSK